MNFKTQKISNKEKQNLSKNSLESFPKETKSLLFKEKEKENTQNKIPKIGINLIVFLLLLGIGFMTYGIYKTISHFDYSVLLKVAGTKLLTDDEGQTNFLILGIGGDNHEGGNLTDSIIIASLDDKKKHISMVSIPRDFYIRDSTLGNSRINEVYFYAKRHFQSDILGINFLKEKIENFIDTEIHYYLMLDFQGFKEIIDTLGGIEVNVEKDINDPYYPKDGTILYETFRIKKGLQTLDGETALKYARSRKTTSDFDRSNRQQEIIFATKEKALSLNTLLSTEKISEILNSLKENIKTNISVGEILTLASIAKDYSKDNISSHLLHDDPNSCGGLLYTPPRVEYGGSFVLLPAGGIDYLHKYFNLLFNYSKEASTSTKIHILNGTKKGGVATETRQILIRYCFLVNRFGNGRNQNIKETTYYYKERINENGEKISIRPDSLDFLQEIIPGKESSEIPEEYIEYILDTDIILEIGDDYVSSENYIKDPFYYLRINTVSTPSTETTQNTEVEN